MDNHDGSPDGPATLRFPTLVESPLKIAHIRDRRNGEVIEARTFSGDPRPTCRACLGVCGATPTGTAWGCFVATPDLDAISAPTRRPRS